MKQILFIIILLLSLFTASNAFAIEGDTEAGAQLNAIMSPHRNLYGGGVELYARYCIYDGFYVSAGLGIYGARDINFKRDVGLYNIRLGMLYALDILEWIPAVGIHFSNLLSETDDLPWTSDASKGFGIDFDAQIQYRGIRNVGIAAVFAYHLAFKADNYMTAGFSVSWHSDNF